MERSATGAIPFIQETEAGEFEINADAMSFLEEQKKKKVPTLRHIWLSDLRGWGLRASAHWEISNCELPD